MWKCKKLVLGIIFFILCLVFRKCNSGCSMFHYFYTIHFVHTLYLVIYFNIFILFDILIYFSVIVTFWIKDLIHNNFNYFKAIIKIVQANLMPKFDVKKLYSWEFKIPSKKEFRQLTQCFFFHSYLTHTHEHTHPYTYTLTDTHAHAHAHSHIYISISLYLSIYLDACR